MYNLTEPAELVSNNVYMIQLHCMHYIDTLFQDEIDRVVLQSVVFTFSFIHFAH